MSGVSPLLQLLLDRDAAKLAEALAATPALANTPVNRLHPEKPLSTALQWGWLEGAQILVAAGATPSGPALVSAAFSGVLPVMQWVYTSGLDVTGAFGGAQTGPVVPEVGKQLLANQKTTREARVAGLQWLLDVGMDGTSLIYQAAMVTDAGVLGLLAARGVLTLGALATVVNPAWPPPPARPTQPALTIADLLALNDLQHPLAYVLLADKSNALYVATAAAAAAPTNPEAQAALGAAIAAAKASGNPYALDDMPVPAIGTPLHVAVAAPGGAAAALALLAAGADARPLNLSGAGIVNVAVRSNSAEVVKVALEAAAAAGDLLAPNRIVVTARRNQRPPLHDAIQRVSSLAVIQTLLAGGASPVLAADGIPPLARVVYVHKSLGPEARPKWPAAAIVAALAAAGGAVTADDWNPTLRDTVRGFCRAAGLPLP
jgi:hypothetical protein